MTKKQFDRLKPATRRIKITEDVLHTLTRKNRFKVTPGAYCEFNIELIAPSDTQLQKILPKYEKHCKACAIGGLFLSHVRLFNNITLGELDNTYADALEDYPNGVGMKADDNAMLEAMGDYFPAEMLHTIEAAFEGRLIYYGVKWVRRIPNHENRLKAICKNIIANKGNFDITDLPAKAVTRKKTA